MCSLKTWKCKDCCQFSSSCNSASASTTLTFSSARLRGFKNEVFLEFENVKSEMSKLFASMKFISDGVDAFNTLMNKLKQEMAAIRKENENLCVVSFQLISQ